jgi:cardiolipin synthase
MFSWSLIFVASEWIIRLAMLFVVPRRRAPSAAMSWLLLIMALPWFGLLLFVVFGTNRLPKRRIRLHERKASTAQQHLHHRAQQAHVVRPQLDAEMMPLVSLAERLGEMPILGGNGGRLLTDTDEVIDALIADIDAAEQHVHMMFYIYADDAIGRRVSDAIVRAAGRGVACRVLADAVGSRRFFKRLAPDMRAGGVEVHELLPVNFIRRGLARVDLRNHRKLAVIDGRIGWTGSQNIVDPSYGHKRLVWHDMMLRVEGPIVLQLQQVFAEDWFCETDQELAANEIFVDPIACGEGVLQTLASGPTYDTENYQRIVIAALYGAKQRIIMTSPYLVPDEPFMQALHVAVLRGVRVQIVVPRKSDYWLPDLAARAYFDELLTMGVELYLHQQGLLHAKSMTVDDSLALVGSGNFDIRSFRLNFELNMLAYGPNVTAYLRHAQQRYIDEAFQLELERWRRRPHWKKAAEGIAMLASPLL